MKRSPTKLRTNLTFEAMDKSLQLPTQASTLAMQTTAILLLQEQSLSFCQWGRGLVNHKIEAQRDDKPHGHGTHVCGTITGQDIDISYGLVGGVAKDAKLVVLRRLRALKLVGRRPGNKNSIHLQRDYATVASEIDGFVRSNPESLHLLLRRQQ